MKYWVFTDAQLDAALAAFIKRLRRQQGEGADFAMHVTEHTVRGFLDSPEARVHKLQGGASYQPDRTAL